MLSDRIAELRNERKYSMRQMAAALNLPYTTYVNYEKGQREPNSEMLVLMAKYFEVSLDYLLCRTDIRQISPNDIVEENPPDVLDVHAGDDAFVLSKYNRLSIPNRYETLKYMDKLYEEQEAEEAAAQMNNIG